MKECFSIALKKRDYLQKNCHRNNSSKEEPQASMASSKSMLV